VPLGGHRIPRVVARVVLDYPTRFWLGRIGRFLQWCWGGALLVVGTTAWLVLVPSLILLAMSRGDEELATWIDSQRQWASTFYLALGVAAACVVLGVRGRGQVLRRRPVRLVLFLRRFGYSDATDAVSHATARMRGAWRVMTLDDASLAPIPVTAAVRWPMRLAWGVSSLFSGTVFVVYKVLEGLVALLMLLWSVSLWSACVLIALDMFGYDVQPYRTALQRVFSGRPLSEVVSPDLPGVYAALLLPGYYLLSALASARAATVFGAVGRWADALPDYALAALAGGGLAGIIVSSAIRNASKASLAMIDRTSTVEIASPHAIDRLLSELRRASTRRFGARLTVVKVAGHIWRQTVTAAARDAAVTLIDVSDVSEHLIWELDMVAARRVPVVYVGQVDRVGRLTREHAAPPSSWDERLAELLDGEEILAYETDARGRRRFARALRNKLSALPPKY